MLSAPFKLTPRNQPSSDQYEREEMRLNVRYAAPQRPRNAATSGSINYSTGAVLINYAVPPSAGVQLAATYQYSASGSGIAIYSLNVSQQGNQIQAVDNNGDTYAFDRPVGFGAPCHGFILRGEGVTHDPPVCEQVDGLLEAARREEFLREYLRDAHVLRDKDRPALELAAHRAAPIDHERDRRLQVGQRQGEDHELTRWHLLRQGLLARLRLRHAGDAEGEAGQRLAAGGLVGRMPRRRRPVDRRESQQRSARRPLLRLRAGRGWVGERAYAVLWKRLFDLKFYEYADQLSAAWIGTRSRPTTARDGPSKRTSGTCSTWTA